MEKEDQNIEYKERWSDDCLKGICGFANAQGGKMQIGKNDKGVLIGVDNAKELLDTLPNKINNILELVVDVNLLEENGLQYIEIDVGESNSAINYKGQYYYRSGATTRVLRGNALNHFLLEKGGLRWDAVTVDGVKVEDLDKESFDIFRRGALKSKKATKEALDIPNEMLLENLGLLYKGKLTRAAIMCFHRNQEKYFPNCYAHISKFEGSEILYEDEVHGSLILILEKLADLSFLKYFKAAVSYDGFNRVETYPFPYDAVREAFCNALIHCDWSDQNPVQIKVYEEYMLVGNSCVLPIGWNAETLKSIHISKPFNPKIANVFYEAGYIEKMGRGIEKMFSACKEIGAEGPEFIIAGESITTKLNALKRAIVKENKNSKHYFETKNVGLDVGLDVGLEYKVLALILGNPKITNDELAEKLKVTTRTIERVVQELRKRGKLERAGGRRYGYWTIPDWLSSELKKVMNKDINNVKNVHKMSTKCPQKMSTKNVHKNDSKNKQANLADNSSRILLKDMILSIVNNDRRSSIRKMANTLGVNPKTIQRVINELKKEGKIVRIGGTNGGYWKIN